LLSSGFTAADIGVGQAVYMAQHFAKLDAHPRVADWYQRISGRAGFQKSLPQGAPLFAQSFFEPWPIV